MAIKQQLAKTSARVEATRRKYSPMFLP